jgi:peptidoglycan-associated lipoprotein
MKRSSLLFVAFVGLVLVLNSTGCKTHRKNNLTEIPGEGAPTAPPPTAPSNSNPNPGVTVPPPENPSATPANIPGATGIPISDSSKWSHIWTGPHDEDRDKFKADTVYFDFDSATIKSSEETKLQDVANFFKTDDKDALQVEVNCDERGTEKYNLSLGERRALAIREYLARLGMDPQRIHTVTYGAYRPVDPGHNEDAWKKNRRGELILLIPK